MTRLQQRVEHEPADIGAARLIASTIEPFIDGIMKVCLFFAPDGRYFLEYECSGWWWHLEREHVSADQAARIFDALDRRVVSRAEAFP
ncbi:MAG TPA: hypothetical protein PKA95_02985 [Thermomicrobiales bacterium]|nr:hypothetical protein [Thermomicrobiales bacterium]